MHQSSYYGWHPSVSEVIWQSTCEETDNSIEQNWKQESKVDVPRDAIYPIFLQKNEASKLNMKSEDCWSTWLMI